MRKVLGALVLLLQFGPLAAAGICLHAAAQPKTECSMPVKDMAHETGAPHSSQTQGCAQMVLCAPAAPMVPVTVLSFKVALPSSTNFANPASLLSVDPIAPPQPPPIV